MDPRSSSLGGGPSPAPGSPKKEISSSCLALFKDAIKRIKNQKQRPGFDRIAQTLKTHHSFSDLHSIKQNLDIAVRDGLLLTVWTKGLQCYKDPDNLRSLRKFTVTSPAETRRAVKAAVREIGDPIGSKLPTIFNYVRYSFMIKVADLEGAIRQAVENLIKKGDLTCNEGDRYRPSHSMAEGGRLQNSASSSLLDAVAEDEDSAMPTSVTTSTPASPIKHNPMSPSKIKVESKTPLTFTSQPSTANVAPSKTDKAATNVSEVSSPSKSVTSGRQFHRFQCWCCHLFTADQKAFLRHVASRAHSQLTNKKIIYCMSCQFRSRNSKRLLAHLKKHDCHSGKSWSPACLLTFGIYTTLTQP